MSKSFVHLHVHADGSALDGLANVKDLVQAAGELGMTSIAITDHGSMSATSASIKPQREQTSAPSTESKPTWLPLCPAATKNLSAGTKAETTTFLVLVRTLT